jgi:hypothetical protein
VKKHFIAFRLLQCPYPHPHPRPHSRPHARIHTCQCMYDCTLVLALMSVSIPHAHMHTLAHTHLHRHAHALALAPNPVPTLTSVPAPSASSVLRFHPSILVGSKVAVIELVSSNKREHNAHLANLFIRQRIMAVEWSQGGTKM